MALRHAFIASLAAVLVMPVFSAIALASSVLFMVIILKVNIVVVMNFSLQMYTFFLNMGAKKFHFFTIFLLLCVYCSIFQPVMFVP